MKTGALQLEQERATTSPLIPLRLHISLLALRAFFRKKFIGIVTWSIIINTLIAALHSIYCAPPESGIVLNICTRFLVASGRFPTAAWPRQPYSQCAYRNTKQTDNSSPRTSENYPF